MNVDGNLRKIFRDNLIDAQWTSIETGMVSPGTPDSEYCFKWNRSGWVEFKKTNVNVVAHMKPLQIGWLERRCRVGGRAFVAVRKVCEAGPRRVECDELWLIRGDGARWLRSDGLEGVPREMMLGRWEKGPIRWDWAAVRQALCA